MTSEHAFAYICPPVDDRRLPRTPRPLAPVPGARRRSAVSVDRVVAIHYAPEAPPPP